MGKRSNITHQALQNLQKQTKYGESKYEAKKKARQEAKEKGEYFREVRGIYSTTTYESYKKVCKQFVATVVKEHKEVKNFNDCRKYVEEFLQDKIDKGCSAWTVSQYGSALACAYDCRKNDFDIVYPTRSRADIKRCRGINSSDYRYPEEKYDTIKMVLKATGCRRMEVLRLRREDFRERPDGTMEVFKRGKGGIEKWCLVNPRYTDEIKDWVRTTETYRIDGEDRLVLKAELPTGSIHDCRADYAADLYRYFEKRGDVETGEIYYCKKDLAGVSFDKGILEEISYNLQHSRNNVVVTYLWKLGRD
ncbi:MAG: hypothetical protein HFI03_07890 [Lachnospiraceae bacterium]|jgi:integrase|nr:hypothetical protein [Lachnospiraceae bacterium]